MSAQLQDAYIPTQEDVKTSREALEALSPLRDQMHLSSNNFELRFEKLKRSISVPPGVLELFFAVLSEAAKGNSITLIPLNKEFTTQEAADYLNVSRPHVISLLETGKIPFRKVGSHRRIKFSDLMTYKQASDLESKRAFEELAALSQDLKLDYD